MLEPKSLDDILLNEENEYIFLECLDSMRDTAEDFLFNIPDFDSLEKEV